MFVFCAGMVERQFYNKHNVVVGLDPNALGTARFREIIEFLLRSRVFYVLTHSPILQITHIREFWATFHLDCEPTPAVLRVRVNNNDIAFSRADLREILQLGSAEEESGPTEYPVEMRIGAFQRMGYAGDLTKSQFTKSYLYGQWRYL